MGNHISILESQFVSLAAMHTSLEKLMQVAILLILLLELNLFAPVIVYISRLREETET